jgi:hypothetical protein
MCASSLICHPLALGPVEIHIVGLALPSGRVSVGKWGLCVPPSAALQLQHHTLTLSSSVVP